MSTRPARALFALVAAAALVASCTGSDQPADKTGPEAGDGQGSGSTTLTTRPEDPGYKPALVASGCADPTTVTTNTSCFTLTLPEDRDRPTGRQVELPVIRVKSPPGDAPAGAADTTTGTGTGDIPIVYLHGGPGGGAVEGWLAWQQLMDGLPGELVVFDQRGGGHANPRLDCPERAAALATVFAEHPTWKRSRQQVADSIDACNERLRASGVDLSRYDLAALVSDLEDLRISLGAEKIRLFGASYGTRIALTYQQLYPQRVASMVLSGVVASDSGGPKQERRMLDPALSRLFGSCSADPLCGSRFPRLKADLSAAGEALDTTPVTLGSEATIKVTGDELYAGVFAALYDTSTIPLLPMAINRIASGDPHIWPTVGSQLSPALAGDSAFGAQISISCSDLAGFVDDRTARSDPGRSRDLVLTGTDSFCGEWTTGGGDPPGRGPAGKKTDNMFPPTLVIAGELDPITPTGDARKVAELLGARYVEVPRAGHDAALTSQCARDALRSFLGAPTARTDADPVCGSADALPFS